MPEGENGIKRLRIKWEQPDNIASQRATHFVVQHDDQEFV
jgi:hypothetical protein